MNDDAKLCYSYKEAQEATSASRTTLWRMVQRGDLVVVHIGSRAFITAKSLKIAFGPKSEAA